MKRCASWWWLLAVLVLIALAWLGRPFETVLFERHAGVGHLSLVQRQNILQAMRQLDGTVIAPGAEFSFNRQVGERTAARGYRPAPAYVGGDRPDSLGGGICVLSSMLYEAALSSGFEIVARTPHLRPVATIPPGLDATVWLDETHTRDLDLRFKNTHPQPVRLRLAMDAQNLSVRVLGQGPSPDVRLQRVLRPGAGRGLDVWVYRALDEASRQLVSHDRYRD